MEFLPQHLSKFHVQQSQQKYTPQDQAVWRYILRQLKTFLSKHAHPFYLEGLKQTGITVDSIPEISEVSKKLSVHGWRACAVSGFIPPAAFMEMQSLSVLPIASDMRSIDQLLYTPAPDIVHEAAGHAPMLAHAEYANYLKEYAQVAKYAIASKEDLDVYSAIRILSDVKANFQATEEEIQAAERNLQVAIKNVSHVSEATQLSRMNWWTAEYGLIGSLENPKIYGAGLLSSVGEAKWCLSENVKKIPLTIDCINYNYDITEPQPQLFVTSDFKNLSVVLAELAKLMAYQVGGEEGIKKAIQSRTINTLQLSSGVQISGQVTEYKKSQSGEIAFIKTSGPTQISYEGQQLNGHSTKTHAEGFSSPIGNLKAFPTKCPSQLSTEEWKELGIHLSSNSEITLEFLSGFVVTGRLLSSVIEKSNRIILSLENAKAVFQNQTLFEPSWGTYDIVLGQSVTSVFGGPADRLAFGELSDFEVARVPVRKFTDQDYRIFGYYQIIRDVRDGKKTFFDLEAAIDGAIKDFPQEWLLILEALELTLLAQQKKLENICREHLNKSIFNDEQIQCIREGLAIAHAKSI